MGTDKKYQPSYSHCYYVKATPSTSWPVTNTNSQDDKGNYEFWQAPQQISHTVCVVAVPRTTFRRKCVRRVVTQVHESEASTGVQRPREERPLVPAVCDI